MTLTPKALLRARVREAMRVLSARQREEGSARICARVADSPLWRGASSVLLYAPLPGEADIWPLAQAALAAGKQLALPFYCQSSGSYAVAPVPDLDRAVVTGHFGIREPAGPCRENRLKLLDLILVPGVAFDPQGGRLGRGKGIYDQLLAALRGPRWGIAFDEQVVERVPTEPHDLLVNCIVTPTRWIERPRGNET